MAKDNSPANPPPEPAKPQISVLAIGFFLLIVLAGFVGIVQGILYISQNTSNGFRLGVAIVVGLLPAILVLQHGIFLLTSKPNLRQDNGLDATEQNLAFYRQKAQAEANRQFGFWSIAFDYFLPMSLTAIVGVGAMFYLVGLVPESNFQTITESTEALVGAGYGTLGAFVYVLMMLGERTFQRDISPGAAIWSTVQLVLGPILGAGLGGLLGNDRPGFNPIADPSIGKPLLYFFAGLAPRPVVNFIQQTVRNALSKGQATKAKRIPLQTIRGIDQRIEDRLFEEGITDGFLLAMANPIRLHRNTPFDLRQIISWIDECILFAVLPEKHAEALQENGVGGAIDLAYYWELAHVANQAATPGPIEALAERIHVDDPQMLKDTIQRLYEDAQVRLIWSLYQAIDT